MSPKELLYIEDTLGHLQTMEQLLTQAKSTLQNQKLRTYVSKQLTKTKQQFNEFYKLLGE